MSNYYSQKKYDLIGFRKSTKKNAKYDAILENKKKNKKIVIVSFGAIKQDGIPYAQYRDNVPLGLYSKYDHLDEERKEKYLKRHSKDINKPYSKSWLSKVFLWT